MRIKELRAGRSRTVRLTVPVQRGVGGRACVRVAVNAASARGATARRCAPTPHASMRAEPSATLPAHRRRTAAPSRAANER
jgi:hypothetical protein